MISSFSKSMPLLISMVLSMIIYFNMDKEDNFTQKISAYIPIKQEFKSLFCVFLVFLIIPIIGILGIYVFPIENYIYYALIGIISGVGISLAIKLSPKTIK